MIRTAIIAATLATGAAAILPTQAMAQVDVNVLIGVPPPPPRWEAVPPPRMGYVWAPGYWGWNGHRHVWVSGNWIAERPGYVYAAPRWVERQGGWYYESARWNRYGPRGDLDHDGIPNRYDRDRDGDGRPNWSDRDPDHYNRNRGHAYYDDPRRGGYLTHNGRRDRDHDGVPDRHDRDRDGDGVPNRYDYRPDNPYRR